MTADGRALDIRLVVAVNRGLVVLRAYEMPIKWAQGLPSGEILLSASWDNTTPDSEVDAKMSALFLFNGRMWWSIADRMFSIGELRGWILDTKGTLHKPKREENG